MPLSATASFGGHVSSSLVSIKSINGTAKGLGEIAGPALAVTVRIDNKSAKSIDLSNVTVDLDNAKNNPGSPLSTSPTDPFAGVLKPGGRMEGTYTFSVGTAERNPVTISVSYTTDAPVVVFVGNAS